ncbi:hypothetical protein PV11_05395 [Exophiala sideris]|uniref:Uncharacterized protein n=1 Tax=Exophiala sideris TaxID=1016849 RepID=A0A0D1Z9C5_9EURO|nr:hypothetical protein PV11_05395 [Exophiala sideris]
MPRPRAVLDHFQAILPSVFQTLSMVFVLMATTSKKWAYNDSFQAGPDPVNLIPVRLHRSPVFNCVPHINTTTMLPFEFCYSTAPQLCDPTSASDNVQLCYLLAFSKRALIAANVLIGLACVFGIILCLAAVVGNRRRHHKFKGYREGGLTYGALVTFLCSLTGTITLVVVQMVATNALLYSQIPQGNFITTDGATQNESPWMPGDYQKYLFLSWGLGVLGMFTMLSVWRLPDWFWAIPESRTRNWRDDGPPDSVSRKEETSTRGEGNQQNGSGEGATIT